MALSEQVILDISAAQRQIDALEAQLRTLSQPVRVPVEVTGEQAADQLRQDIARAEGSVDSLNRELAQTDRELDQMGASSRVAGRDLEQAGTRGAQAFSNLRGSINAIGVGLVAAVGIRAAVDAIQEAIRAASDLEESLSKTNVVFGEFGDEIRDIASDAPRALGLSTQAALEATSTFGNLFTALGLTREQAADLSPQIVQLGADLASFNNISVDEAVIALRAGLVGEVEPLRRLGVAINAAVVEQKALELGLASTSGEITEAAKVQARYALILEQTTNAQGDFARTADGLANSMRTTAAEIENARAEVGTAFAPTLQALLPLAADAASSVSFLALSFGELIGTVPPGTAALNQLRDAVGEIEDPLQALITLIVEANDEFGRLDQPGNQVRIELDTEEIQNFIRELGLASSDIDRLRTEAGQAFLLELGFERADIDLLIRLLEENVVNAAIAARDALIHSAEGGERFIQAMKGITSFSPELARFRAELSSVDQVTRSEAEALNILQFYADQSGVSLAELVTNTEGLTGAQQTLVGFLSDGARSFLEQVAAIDEVQAELEALPHSFDVVSEAFRNSQGDITTSTQEFIDNLTETLENTRSFEINLARLAAQGFDALATQIREEGPGAAGLLNNFLKDPAAAAEADALARGQATLIADGLFNQLFADVEQQDITPAFIAMIQQLAAVTTDPEVQAVLLAIASGLSEGLVLTPTIGPPVFSPEALRATGGSVSPPITRGGGTGGLTPALIIETNIINSTTKDLNTDAARAAQTIGSVVRATNGRNTAG